MSSKTGRAPILSGRGSASPGHSGIGLEKPKQRKKYAKINVHAMMAGDVAADTEATTQLESVGSVSGIPGVSRFPSGDAADQPGLCGIVSPNSALWSPESRRAHCASGPPGDQTNVDPDPVAASHESKIASPINLQVQQQQEQEESSLPTAPAIAPIHNGPLPRGWRQCEDDNGEIYFWHVRSGAVQRERPVGTVGDAADSPSEVVPDANDWRDSTIPLITARPSSSKKSQSKSKSPSPRKDVYVDDQRDTQSSDYLNRCEAHLINLAESCTYVRESHSPAEEDGLQGRLDAGEGQQRFTVRSLGWLSLAETDLADTESSSKAINRCITELTSSRGANDSVAWVEGKEIYLDIEGTELCLTDPATAAVLCTQPVQSIRVWAISGQSPSDFAYVARDLARQLKCHVFRCDFAARRVTEALQAACSRAALERKRRSGGSPSSSAASSAPMSPVEGQPLTKAFRAPRTDLGNPTLPSPMEGPKKAMRCQYLGCLEVHRPTGIDVLNSAIEKMLHKSNDSSKWQSALVVVSPSVVLVSDAHDESLVLAECRIRYLSFLGISSTDVRLCGFIMHSAEDEFIAHVFHCEPSAGAICKTIEAACKLRFQKCLDAQPDLDVSKGIVPAQATSAGKVLQETVKKGVQNILSKMWPSRKA